MPLAATQAGVPETAIAPRALDRYRDAASSRRRVGMDASPIPGVGTTVRGSQEPAARPPRPGSRPRACGALIERERPSTSTAYGPSAAAADRRARLARLPGRARRASPRCPRLVPSCPSSAHRGSLGSASVGSFQSKIAVRRRLGAATRARGTGSQSATRLEVLRPRLLRAVLRRVAIARLACVCAR
jgi:hypothetical protein